MESRLIIKNVNYNKYHDIFSFISRQGFKKYRKKKRGNRFIELNNKRPSKGRLLIF